MNIDPMADIPPELKQNLTRYQAPPGLRRRIQYMLDQQAPSTEPAARVSRLKAWPRWWQGLASWLSVGTGFACGALLTLALVHVQGTLQDRGQTQQQVVTSHVRSLMVAHLTDVASSDQHTVKPWFTGKLDYAPPVTDAAAQGFALVGGRLDYLQNRPVAALVYRHHEHTINVFVLPSGQKDTLSTRFDAEQGFQLAHWSRGGMHYWAVSDLGRDELARFAAILQAAF